MWPKEGLVQEFLFISLQPSCGGPEHVQAFGVLVFRYLPLLQELCSVAFWEGCCRNAVLCWWDREVGDGLLGSLPLPGWFPGQAGWYSQLGLDHTPVPLEEWASRRWCLVSACWLVLLWEERWSSQSTHFQRDVVSCACLAALSQNMTDQGPRQPGCSSQEGILWWLLRGKGSRSCSLTGSCGWVVSHCPFSLVCLP